jgi:hypothetical protein
MTLHTTSVNNHEHGAAGGCVFEEEKYASWENAGKPDALYHDRRTNIQIAWRTLA